MRERPELADCIWIRTPDLDTITTAMPRVMVHRPASRLVALCNAIVEAAGHPHHPIDSSSIWVHPSEAGRIVRWMGQGGSGRCGPEAIQNLELWAHSGFSEWDRIPAGWLAIESEALC